MSELNQNRQQDYLVKISGLTKKFGNRVVVSELNLTIPSGQYTALLGPNGAGKTTTIKMILGLVQPTSGKIEIFGMDSSSNLTAIKKRIGVAPQIDNLDPDLTLLENMLVYGSYFSIPKKIAKERAFELLDFFALFNRKDEIIQNLSGGQRRRVLLARALINDPELLILDEPTIGLDPQARHVIWDRLLALKDNGTTLLLTSHYMVEVENLANHVFIMDHGKIAASGGPQELIAKYAGKEVFEIPGVPERFDAIEQSISECQIETERTPNKLYIYVYERCLPLEEQVMELSHFVRRPANLEDVFLKLTGRTLEES